jgi:hypothetical protein
MVFFLSDPSDGLDGGDARSGIATVAQHPIDGDLVGSGIHRQGKVRLVLQGSSFLTSGGQY